MPEEPVQDGQTMPPPAEEKAQETKVSGEIHFETTGDKLPKHLITDRYRNRRHMAWISFILIAMVGIILVFVGLLSDSLAERIDRLSFVIGTMFGVWISVVLAYFGATTVTDITGIK